LPKPLQQGCKEGLFNYPAFNEAQFYFLNPPKNLYFEPMEEKKDLILRDWLAIERTKLANERTFLAYFRTAFVFLATGMTFLKLDYFEDFRWLGVVFLALFPVMLILGIIRLFKVKRNIDCYYQ
jgi:putative membrane protein